MLHAVCDAASASAKELTSFLATRSCVTKAEVTCAVYSDVGEIAATYNDDDVYLFAPEASMVGLGGAEGRFLVDLTGLKASGARCGGGFARDRDNLGNYCNIFSIFVLFAWMLRLHECCYLRFRSCFIC